MDADLNRNGCHCCGLPALRLDGAQFGVWARIDKYHCDFCLRLLSDARPKMESMERHIQYAQLLAPHITRRMDRHRMALA